jgi:hypothetical protein
MVGILPDAPAYPYTFAWAITGISNSTVNLAKEAGNATLNLISEKNSAKHGFVSSVESGSWVTKTSDTTTGTQNAKFSYTANTTYYERSAIIKVVQNDSLDEIRLKLVQAAAPMPEPDPSFEFDFVSGIDDYSGTYTVSASTTSVTLNFFSRKDNVNTGYSVAKTGSSWFTGSTESTITTGASFVTSKYTFAANPGFTARTATLVFTQSGSSPKSPITVILTQQPKDDEYVLKFDDTSNMSFGYAANSTVTRNVTSTKNGSWVGFSVTSPSNITASTSASSGTSRSYVFKVTEANSSQSPVNGSIQLTQN